MEPEPRTEEQTTVAVPPVSLPSWRQLAHKGEYAKAYARLQAQGQQAVRDEAGELLLVADVARLSGHAEEGQGATPPPAPPPPSRSPRDVLRSEHDITPLAGD